MFHKGAIGFNELMEMKYPIFLMMYDYMNYIQRYQSEDGREINKKLNNTDDSVYNIGKDVFDEEANQSNIDNLMQQYG